MSQNFSCVLSFLKKFKNTEATLILSKSSSEDYLDMPRRQNSVRVGDIRQSWFRGSFFLWALKQQALIKVRTSPAVAAVMGLFRADFGEK